MPQAGPAALIRPVRWPVVNCVKSVDAQALALMTSAAPRAGTAPRMWSGRPLVATGDRSRMRRLPRASAPRRLCSKRPWRDQGSAFTRGGTSSPSLGAIKRAQSASAEPDTAHELSRWYATRGRNGLLVLVLAGASASSQIRESDAAGSGHSWSAGALGLPMHQSGSGRRVSFASGGGPSRR